MSNLRKIIAWIFVFAIIIYGLFVPAFASVNPDPTDSRGNFYDWVVNQGGSFSGGRPDDSIGGGRYSKDHYDDFVSELPATGITSAGNLIYRLTPNVLTRGNYWVTTTGSIDLITDVPFINDNYSNVFFSDAYGYGLKRS